MTHLIMRRGPQPGKVFNLESEVVTVGSGMKNNIVIQDNDVSREHCRLLRVMADYEVHDLNSMRGTFVSGQRVNSGWLLKPGSVIELGDNITLEYERGTAGTELNNMESPNNVHHTEKPSKNAFPSLVMTVGPKAGDVFHLQSEVIRIGRDSTNDIVVADAAVSRFHAELRWKDKTYEVVDLGSTNGTLINNTPIPANESFTLRSNDSVAIATIIEMRYTWQPDDVKRETELKSIPTIARPSTKELAQIDTNENKILNPRSKRQTSKLGTGLQPGALVDHVFITYARPDWQTIVAPMMALMQDAGIKVWVDQYLIQGGDDWMLAVEQALSECWLLLVVVSPESLDSRYSRLAYRYFFNREKPIVPLLYAGVDELPLELRKYDVVRYNSADRKKTFDDLINQVKRQKR
ncbi:MAG: FHA domain-containing protein [Anaerolineae bacterium]